MCWSDTLSSVYSDTMNAVSIYLVCLVVKGVFLFSVLWSWWMFFCFLSMVLFVHNYWQRCESNVSLHMKLFMPLFYFTQCMKCVISSDWFRFTSCSVSLSHLSCSFQVYFTHLCFHICCSLVHTFNFMFFCERLFWVYSLCNLCYFVCIKKQNSVKP